MSEIPEGYKQTEVGVIPEEWEEERLGKECELITKGTTPTSLGKEFKDNGINFIKIESLDENGNIIKEKVAFIDEGTNRLLKRSQLKENDVLVSIAGALGRIAIVKADILPANTNQALAIVRLKPQTKLDRNYLFYYLNSARIKKHIEAINVQAAQANLSLENINDFVILYSSLPEQQAIASALSDVDALITALEQLITKKRNIKRGAMQQLLTGKKRLPGFSGEWEVINISEKSVLKARIGWQGLTTAEYLKNGEYYLVTGTDFIDGKIKWSGCHFVDKNRYVQDKNIQLRNGDVLITKDGTIGKVGYIDNLPGNATLNSGVFVIRPRDKSYFPLFFYYILKSSIFDAFMNQLQAGSTISHLYQKDFVNFSFLAPSLDEQQAIAQILSDMDTEIEALQQKRDKYKALKQGMMQELLTGKTRLIKED